MCMDCGCGAAHGDPEQSKPHLVFEDLKKMATADEVSVAQVLANINDAAEKDRVEHPSEWA